MATKISCGGKQYQIGKCIGVGKSGKVFKGLDLENCNVVAIKLQGNKGNSDSFNIERLVYETLKDGIGIPKLHGFQLDVVCGDMGTYNVLVIDYLKPWRLSALSLKTICLLALQMINIVQYMHSRNVIHCDLKLDHFLMDPNYNQIYIIDFNGSEIEDIEHKWRDLNFLNLTLRRLCEYSKYPPQSLFVFGDEEGHEEPELKILRKMMMALYEFENNDNPDEVYAELKRIFSDVVRSEGYDNVLNLDPKTMSGAQEKE